MSERRKLTFRDGEKILTLWVEKVYDEGYTLGWCPELENNIVVHPRNVVSDSHEIVAPA